MKSVSSSSPAGPAASVLRTMARNESTTTIAGFDRLDLLHDGFQHLRHPPVERLLAEVDEANRAVADLGGVEEGVLLLVAQHLDGRLADDAEVHGLSLGARVREHDLMRQRRLAAPRAAGDQIERELRNPAAQHLVEARHAGGQLANRNAVAHFLVSLGAVSSIVGQALRSTWIVSRSPMKVVMSSRKVPNRTRGRLGGDGGIERLQIRAQLRRAFEPDGHLRRGTRDSPAPASRYARTALGRRLGPGGGPDERRACRRPARRPRRTTPTGRQRLRSPATSAPSPPVRHQLASLRPVALCTPNPPEGR